jgi:phosphate starvation-inducible protein PhoH
MQNTLDTFIDVSLDGQSLSGKSTHSKISPQRSTTLSKNRKMATKPTSRSARYASRAVVVDDQPVSNVVQMKRNYKRVEILPRNTAQETYVEALLDKRMVKHC